MWRNMLCVSHVLFPGLYKRTLVMTFPNDDNRNLNDGNRNLNRNRENNTNYTPWIIGAAAVALLIGAYSMMSDRTTNTAAVKTEREITRTTPAVPAPSTPSPTSPNNPTR